MKSGHKERARRAEAKKQRRRKRGGSGKYEPLVVEPVYELNVPLFEALEAGEQPDPVREVLMGLRRR